MLYFLFCNISSVLSHFLTGSNPDKQFGITPFTSLQLLLSPHFHPNSCYGVFHTYGPSARPTLGLYHTVIQLFLIFHIFVAFINWVTFCDKTLSRATKRKKNLNWVRRKEALRKCVLERQSVWICVKWRKRENLCQRKRGRVERERTSSRIWMIGLVKDLLAFGCVRTWFACPCCEAWERGRDGER